MDHTKQTPVVVQRAALGSSSSFGGELSSSLRITRDLSSCAPLVEQAHAAELRALASAAWHRERAGRYLAWHDLPWAAQRYAEHCDAAAFQDAIAARHRSVAAALGAVRL